MRNQSLDAGKSETMEKGPLTLLLVDDEENILASLRRLLRRDGYLILCAGSGEEGLKLLEKNHVDVIVSDQRMPQMTGVEFLRKARVISPETVRIVLSGFTELQSIIDAVNEGAVYKFLTKPWEDDQLRSHIREAFRQKGMVDENLSLSQKLAEAYSALAVSNRELQGLLSAKDQRLACDETALGITQEILDGLPLALVGFDNENMIVFSNQQAQKLFSAYQCNLGSSASQCLPPELFDSLTNGACHEKWAWHNTGNTYCVSCYRMGSSSGSLGRVVMLIPCCSSQQKTESSDESHDSENTDFSQPQERSDDAPHRIRHDALTSLPDRSLFYDRLEQALQDARRSGRGLALILVDIDRFRTINDALGHQAGDEILLGVARRLGALIRSGDTLARLSGNEFCFVLNSLGDEGDSVRVAQRILESIASPFVIEQQVVTLTASMGISVFPKDGESADALLKAANTAMFRAKDAGRNGLLFYDSGMESQSLRRLQIANHLRTALENNEFSLVYQPQVSLESGAINGMEALLRWHNPELGQVSPAEFIPVAEDNGIIVPIGAWVLKTACQQNQSWRDQGLPPLRVAVNLSARQFRDDTILNTVQAILFETGLPPAALELEVTESALINDVDRAVETCRQFHRMGIKISLDDFGTGYASFAYVSRFPFDKLKIDQSFVRDITQNPANAAIAGAAIAIARSLNMGVLAEGIETEAQAAFLRRRHCDSMQGYLFSRPLLPDQFAQKLRREERLQLGEPAGAAEQTVLILDDEMYILTTLCRLFRHEGFRVLTATDPDDAFNLMACNQVQVVVSDQRMPTMSGTEFLARVRQLYPDTVRIVLSGFSDIESVTEAINRGAIYKFLSKPWDDDLLREQIREAFKVARLQKELSCRHENA